MFGKHIALVTAIVGGFLASTGLSHAGIVNGSFEADPYSGQYSTDPTITGWTKIGNDGTYPLGINNSGGLGPTPFGNQFIVMGKFGRGGGGLSQSVSGLTPGNTYTLSFALSSEAPGNSQVQLSLTGASNAGATYLAPSAAFWNTWATFTDTFVATSSTVGITFLDIISPNGGADAGIDNVALSGATVPEAATLALFGFGVVAAGVAGRRRGK